MPPPARTILIADDDQGVCTLLEEQLALHGFQTCSVRTARGLEETVARRHIDLVIMESRFPDGDGFTLTQQLRQQRRIPVIILSAYSQLYDRVIGLESGADDYLGKPFEPREVVARVRAVLRTRPQLRTHGAPADGAARAVAAHWRVDRDSGCLYDQDHLAVPLSPTEFRLLEVFLHAPGHLMSREQLRWQVHGQATRVAVRNIDLLVARLRQKLSRIPHGASAIRTVRGKGYILRTHATDAP